MFLYIIRASKKHPKPRYALIVRGKDNSKLELPSGQLKFSGRPFRRHLKGEIVAFTHARGHG
jgi:hypothetical protein